MTDQAEPPPSPPPRMTALRDFPSWRESGKNLGKGGRQNTKSLWWVRATVCVDRELRGGAKHFSEEGVIRLGREGLKRPGTGGRNGQQREKRPSLQSEWLPSAWALNMGPNQHRPYR